MKTQSNLLSCLSAASFVIGLAVSATASADFISCVGTNPTYDISGKVDTATACTILGPLSGPPVGQANDTPQPEFVNGEGFFGKTDWLFDGKWEGSSDDSSLFNFSTSSTGQSGSFSYVGGSGISDIMFIFKDGNDTNLVGYLVLKANGKYDTPFTDPPFTFKGDDAKDVSHISVYYRQGGTPPQQIPEPGVLFLMGAGLLGLSWARRNKSV